MASEPNPNLFAPPSEEELAAARKTPKPTELFAPPSPEELEGIGPSSVSGKPASNLFAPPTPEELGQASSPADFSTSPYLSEEQLEAVAQRTGADATWLREVAPYYGAQLPGTSKLSPEYLAGFASRGIGMNIPQFLYKKAQGPKERAALDELQKLADERKSLLETGAEIGTAIASGVGLGRMAAKGLGTAAMKAYDVAAMVGSPAVQGVATSREGEELAEGAKGAALGAGLGAAGMALGAGLKRLRKADEAPTDELGRNLIGRVEEARAAEKPGDELFLKSVVEAKTAAPKGGARFGELELPSEESFLLEYAAARNVPSERAAAEYAQEFREFAKTIKSAKASTVDKRLPKMDEAKTLIRDFRASQGTEELARRFDEYRTAKTAQRLFQDSIDTEIRKRTGLNPVRQIAERLIDGAHAARAMDVRMGTSVENTLNDLSRMNARYTLDLKNALKGVNELEDQFLASGLEPEKFYDVLRTGNTEGLTAPQFAVYEAYRKKYDELADQLIGRGIPLQKRKNYVPEHMLPFVDSIAKITQRLNTYAAQGVDVVKEGIDEELFKRLMDPKTGDAHFRDTVRGISLINHEPITTARELQEQARLAMNPATAGARAELTAGAAMARQGAIPDFLLEKDPRRLLVNWAQENLKAANLQPGLSQLRKLRNVARAAGETESAEYLSKLLTDISGRRSDTVAAYVNTQRDRLLLKAKQLLEDPTTPSLDRAFYRTLIDSPEIFGSLFNQVYPNLLGLSPRAVLMNLTQPLLTTLPELGPAYGGKKLLSSYTEFLRNPGKVLREAEEAGFVPVQWSTELRDAVRAGVERGSIHRMSDRALNKWASFAMWAFEKSEALNRGTHYILGKQVAKDVLDEAPSATRFLSSIPVGTRREILQARDSGDVKRLEQLVTGYILNRTMFNYNRITMSEFGRSMGPLFSTFTKWPASIAGDLYTTYLRKGAKEGSLDITRRYLAPMMFAASISHWILGEKEEQSPQMRTAEKLLFGERSGMQRGLAAAAPITSAESVITGRVFKPPFVAAVTDPAVAIVKADPEAFSKWLSNLYTVFFPVLPSAQKFLTETLPAISDATLGTSYEPYAKEPEEDD